MKSTSTPHELFIVDIDIDILYIINLYIPYKVRSTKKFSANGAAHDVFKWFAPYQEYFTEKNIGTVFW